MIVLGIDPGFERMGYGVVRREGSRLEAVAFGLIETPRIELADRLKLIYDQLTQLIEQHNPDAISIEKLLFAVNKKTAFDVSKSIGVVLLCAAQNNIPSFEYTPPEVKLAIVGHGGADKKQVQYMVAKLFGLENAPKPDDVADALAIGGCHALRAKTMLMLK